MDLLNKYSDPDSSDDENPNSPDDNDSSPPRLLPSRSAAPQVDDTMLALSVADPKTLSKPIDPTQHAVGYNPTYDQLWAPIQGPSHPYAKDGLAQGMRNHKLGFVEDANIEPFLFDEQHNTFLKFGYAADPSASNYVGDFDALQKNNAASVYNIPHREQKKRRIEAEKKKEENGDDEDDANNNDGEDGVEIENPASEAWLLKNKKSPWAGKKEGLQGELNEDQKKYGG
jgi:pre-mRNA-processing factor 17